MSDPRYLPGGITPIEDRLRAAIETCKKHDPRPWSRELVADIALDSLAALRDRDSVIAWLQTRARELNDGMCIYCNQEPCLCPTAAK